MGNVAMEERLCVAPAGQGGPAGGDSQPLDQAPTLGISLVLCFTGEVETGSCLTSDTSFKSMILCPVIPSFSPSAD